RARLPRRDLLGLHRPLLVDRRLLRPRRPAAFRRVLRSQARLLRRAGRAAEALDRPAGARLPRSARRSKLRATGLPASRKAAPATPRKKTLVDHVHELLRGGHAHDTFEKVVADWPAKLRAAKPEGASHTAWQLLEHLRICQWDILEFSRNAEHVSPEFPKG